MEYKIEVYYNLYAQKNTLPLADAFESSRNKYLKLYGLDPVYFFSAPELAWMACLKTGGETMKTSNKLLIQLWGKQWKGYTLVVDVDYPIKLQKAYSDLPFLPEIMKIGKCQKLVCNIIAR